MLTLIKGLLTLANLLTKYLSDKQLLDAGADKAIKNNLHDTLQKVDAAIAARRNAKRMPDDKNDRD